MCKIQEKGNKTLLAENMSVYKKPEEIYKNINLISKFRRASEHKFSIPK